MALHGRMRSKRQSVFEYFSTVDRYSYRGCLQCNKCSLYSAVLMCTDVMARGVDIPTVDWVLQFDPPSCAKSAFCTNLVWQCVLCVAIWTVPLFIEMAVLPAWGKMGRLSLCSLPVKPVMWNS